MNPKKNAVVSNNVPNSYAQAMKNTVVVGNRLKLVREIINVSPEFMAKRLGVEPVTVNSIEAGKLFPSYIVRDRLADVFGVDGGWLLFGTDSMFIKDSLNGKIHASERFTEWERKTSETDLGIDLVGLSEPVCARNEKVESKRIVKDKFNTPEVRERLKAVRLISGKTRKEFLKLLKVPSKSESWLRHIETDTVLNIDILNIYGDAGVNSTWIHTGKGNAFLTKAAFLRFCF